MLRFWKSQVRQHFPARAANDETKPRRRAAAGSRR
jgi:hypothetical protein